jgi:hypothetical protein
MLDSRKCATMISAASCAELAVVSMRTSGFSDDGEIQIASLGADFLGVGLQRRKLVLEQHLRFVQQPADQSALAVVHAASYA